MTTRSEREKAQKLNEQHQAILSALLREDDNKFCADCQAKGPRWASWNLGVFMCIRCAGIHRNLGVHISRVKSVNLDQWTSEQIQSMVDMGNCRAKQLYEAHLPESFRRPQTDQAVEVFIRDKYERKKYFDKEALTTAPTECRASPKKSTEPAVDLLGLDAPEGGVKSSGGAAPISDDLDIFGPMVSNPLPSANNTQQAQSSSSTAAPQADTSTSSSISTTMTTKAEEKKLLSKDSILSLYASSSVGSQPQSQQQSAPGQAGMYMGQPQMQFTPQAFNPGMGGVAPPTTMMGGGAMMPGMALPNGGYMQQPGVMPASQGHSMYNMQQGQQQPQGQWNMSQMTQHMSGMAMSGGGPTSGAPAAGWPAAPPTASGQTLSTQLWK
ncbi:stromal membrane-associated protein 1-like isoform X10 [Hippoglossus hippoglossus]|uniref:stromal membrane-associated protein 1-like isoform X10 n=1 Tax=Hippoglossus hippoglossus TaxID=8267 RepID=UPI00148CDB8A|nr:stromal membrane-associated protein 1-like isoform X10 [Hippoglossus hippoglossus]XP_035029229.2 stromal membrane-associated protein 1 isoform X8 [Hippoglossus stenolepis]